MTVRNLLAVAVVLLAEMAVWAQEFPRAEVGFNYAYTRFAPSASYTKGHSLNGGGGSFTFNINDYLGIKADLQGSTSNTTGFNISPNSTFPAGLHGNVQGNLFTYLFGPQIKVRAHKVEPFGHLLFGGAHTNVYGNAWKQLCLNPLIVGGACPTIPRAPTAEAFAMSFGGGVDIPINKLVSFRPGQVEYLLTRFSNPLTKTNNQNNFRYEVGVYFNLGHTTHM